MTNTLTFLLSETQLKKAIFNIEQRKASSGKNHSLEINVAFTAIGDGYEVTDLRSAVVEDEDKDVESIQYFQGYKMIAEWSESDNAFLVTLPDWREDIIQPSTHGDTVEEAFRNGREVLQMFINAANDEDKQ